MSRKLFCVSREPRGITKASENELQTLVVWRNERTTEKFYKRRVPGGACTIVGNLTLSRDGCQQPADCHI